MMNNTGPCAGYEPNWACQKCFIAKPKNRVFTVKIDNFQRLKCFIANLEERP